MNVAKSLASGLNKSFLSLLLLALPAAFLFTFIFSQAQPVKKLVRDSGTYTIMSKSAVETAVTTAETSGQVSGIPKEAVKRAAEKAFSATDMRIKSESVIDSAYLWLNGSRPDFKPQIDIQSNKQVFGQALADEGVQIVNNKPICSYQQLQLLQTSDPTSLLQASCQPPSFNPEVVRSYFTSIISEASQNLQETSPSLSQFFEKQDTANILVAQNPLASSAPALFGVLKYSFYIVICFVVFSLLIFFLLYRQIPDFFRIILPSFLAGGILLVLYSLVGQWLVAKNVLANVLPGAQAEITQELIKPFLTVSLQTSLWFGLVYLVICLIMFIGYRVFKQKQPLPRVNGYEGFANQPPQVDKMTFEKERR